MITKCDKDKCYVKRSGSRTIQENVLMTVEEMLPRSFSHVVCQCKGSGNGGFEAVLRVNVFSEEQAREWKAALETETKITWRKDRTYVTKRSKVLMKEDYRCQHNTKPRSSNATRRYASKNTDCPSQMKIIIHQSIIPDSERVCRVSRSRDPHRWEFPTEVRLKHCHNHPLHDASALKHRDVSEEARAKIDRLLLSGLTPSAALKRFKADLQAADPVNYESVCEDRALCPDTFWVFRRSYVLGRIPKRQRGKNAKQPPADEPQPSTNVDREPPSPAGSADDDHHNEDSASETLTKLRKVEMQQPPAHFHDPRQNVDQASTETLTKLRKVEMQQPPAHFHDPRQNVDQASTVKTFTELRKAEGQPPAQFHDPQQNIDQASTVKTFTKLRKAEMQQPPAQFRDPWQNVDQASTVKTFTELRKAEGQQPPAQFHHQQQQQHIGQASSAESLHSSYPPYPYCPPGSSNVSVFAPVNDALRNSVGAVHHMNGMFLQKSMPPAATNATLQTGMSAVSEASLRSSIGESGVKASLQSSMVAGHVSDLSLQGVSDRNEKCLQNSMGAASRNETSLQSYIRANNINDVPLQNSTSASSVNEASLRNSKALLNLNETSLEKKVAAPDVNEMALQTSKVEPRANETQQRSAYVRTTRVNETSLLCQGLARKLKALQDDWVKKVQENPAQYAEGLAAFVRNAHQIETPSRLVSAWHNFGK